MYPTMKTRTIKCRHSEAPLVEDTVLTPAEADRLAAALTKAAAVARAKAQATRSG